MIGSKIIRYLTRWEMAMSYYSMINIILTPMNDILRVLEVNCHGSLFPTWYNCSLIKFLYLCYVGKCIVYIPEVSHLRSKLGNL